jgi:hypothetical protein
MKFKKIEIGRQGNFIAGMVLIYFLFFGYIANVYKKSIGDELLFLHQVLFNARTFTSFIILFIIVFIISYRESFFEYAIRNSIWLIVPIIILSWFWYWILFGFDFKVFYIYFIRIEGYLTILTLLCTNLFAAIIASIIKQKRMVLLKLK